MKGRTTWPLKTMRPPAARNAAIAAPAGSEIDLVEIDGCDQAAGRVEVGRPEIDLPHHAQPARLDMGCKLRRQRPVVGLDVQRMRSHAGTDAPKTGTTPLTIRPPEAAFHFHDPHRDAVEPAEIFLGQHLAVTGPKMRSSAPYSMSASSATALACCGRWVVKTMAWRPSALSASTTLRKRS